MSDDGLFRLHPDPSAAIAAADQLFAQTLLRLRSCLPDTAVIRHVGATAIPGCLTKGDLDIVVRVDPREFVRADLVLASIYVRNSGSIRTKDFSAFEDGSVLPHLGIQLTAIGGDYDVFHLFADAMRHNPLQVAAYNELKLRYDGKGMNDYREAKNQFVEGILAALHLVK